jgi:acetylornithine deacetylase
MPPESVAGWRQRTVAEAARLEARMRRVHPAAAFRMETRMEVPPLRPEPENPAERLARSLTGDNGTHMVSYQTEAGQFQDMALPTVVCGPGSIAQAHQPDEYISVAQLEAGTAFLRRLIRHLAA